MMSEVISRTITGIVVRNGRGIVTHIARDKLSAETLTTFHLPDPVSAAAVAPSALPVYQEPGVMMPTPVPTPTSLVLPVKMLIKLSSGSKVLVTVLTRSPGEITFATVDGHSSRLEMSRVSNETLASLQLPLHATANHHATGEIARIK